MMNRFKSSLTAQAAIVMCLLAGAGGALASPVSIDAAGASYSQNFDSLAATGTPAWVNDSTLLAWSLYVKTGVAASTYATGTGSSNAGSFYSFGNSGSSDRALGGVGSGGAYFGAPAAGSVAGWIALSLTNNSGKSLSGFSLGFNGEQWRDGGLTTGTTTPAAQSMVMEYGFGSSFAAVSSWTPAGGAFNWATPVFASTTSAGAAVDGNAAGRVNGVGGTVSATWSAGDTLWVRWVENNDPNNDHGLALDNVSFTAGQEVVPAAVPLPLALPLLGFGLVAMGAVGRRRVSQRRG